MVYRAQWPKDGEDDDKVYRAEWPKDDGWSEEAWPVFTGQGLQHEDGADDSIGIAVLDTACQTAMHGRPWRAAFERELARRGLKPRSRTETTSFRGIGGKSKSDTVVTLPVGIFGVSGTIESAELEQDVPCLLSRHTQARLGVRIAVDRKEADFVRLGVHNVPLVETPSGHLGISLLDFGDLDGLSKFLAPKDDAYFVDACSEPEVLAAVPASDSDSDVMDDPAAIDWDLDPAITGVAPGDGDG